MIVKVKDDRQAQKGELRHRADGYMRDRYALMLEDCTVLVLGDSVSSGPPPASNRESYELQPPAIPRPDPLRALSPTFLAGT